MLSVITKAIVGSSISISGYVLVEQGLSMSIKTITPSLVRRIGWSIIAITGGIAGIVGSQLVVEAYQDFKGKLEGDSNESERMDTVSGVQDIRQGNASLG